MVWGIRSRTSSFSALHVLVYAPPSTVANLPCLLGSSHQEGVLTSSVPPTHNLGVSLAPLQDHALWKIFLPTTPYILSNRISNQGNHIFQIQIPTTISFIHVFPYYIFQIYFYFIPRIKAWCK